MSGWTSLTHEENLLRRGGDGDRVQLGQRVNHALELRDIAGVPKISGKSVARLDVRIPFGYNSKPMRDRSYLAPSNTLTTLIQCNGISAGTDSASSAG